MPAYRECGCSPYLKEHNHWCNETPIMAQLVKDFGTYPPGQLLWELIILGYEAP